MTYSKPSATYSAEDNKLRLYTRDRLDPETYARVKGAGFSWAPRQELFVAPKWTPEREDLLLDLAGVIDDEETPLAERAAERAARFEIYSDKRGAEAEAAHAHVESIAGGIPLGQPILVGHHSEKRARKDAEKIRDGMAKAVKLNDTSRYWEERARGVMRHATYKADPGLRARRIKVLEAEERGHRRDLTAASTAIKLWTAVAAIDDPAAQKVQALGLANTRLSPWGLWGELSAGKTDAAAGSAQAISMFEAQIARANRWLDHLLGRLAYERVLLGRAPDEVTKTERRRSESSTMPLLNYRAADGIDGRDKYGRDNAPVHHAQVEMTSSDYARIHADYKGTRVSYDGTHRFRVRAQGRGGLVAVFLSDSKVHPRPAPKPKAPEPEEESCDSCHAPPVEACQLDCPEREEREREAPPVDRFEAMRAALKAGVQAVSVPELFVTPAPLADRMAFEAHVSPGDDVLEPSGGLGALAKAARERGAKVVCVDNARAMTSALRGLGFETHEEDFLNVTVDYLGLFDVVLMNPPFSAEVDHVMHAWSFLKPGGRLVSIMSASVKSRRSDKDKAFRAFVEENGSMEDLPAGSFATSGTGVFTVLVSLMK